MDVSRPPARTRGLKLALMETGNGSERRCDSEVWCIGSSGVLAKGRWNGSKEYDYVSFRHGNRSNAVFIDGHAAPLSALRELRAGENSNVEIYRQFVPKWNGEVY